MIKRLLLSLKMVLSFITIIAIGTGLMCLVVRLFGGVGFAIVLGTLLFSALWASAYEFLKKEEENDKPKGP